MKRQVGMTREEVIKALKSNPKVINNWSPEDINEAIEKIERDNGYHNICADEDSIYEYDFHSRKYIYIRPQSLKKMWDKTTQDIKNFSELDTFVHLYVYTRDNDGKINSIRPLYNMNKELKRGKKTFYITDLDKLFRERESLKQYIKDNKVQDIDILDKECQIEQDRVQMITDAVLDRFEHLRQYITREDFEQKVESYLNEDREEKENTKTKIGLYERIKKYIAKLLPMWKRTQIKNRLNERIIQMYPEIYTDRHSINLGDLLGDDLFEELLEFGLEKNDLVSDSQLKRHGIPIEEKEFYNKVLANLYLVGDIRTERLYMNPNFIYLGNGTSISQTEKNWGRCLYGDKDTIEKYINEIKKIIMINTEKRLGSEIKEELKTKKKILEKYRDLNKGNKIRANSWKLSADIVKAVQERQAEIAEKSGKEKPNIPKPKLEKMM